MGRFGELRTAFRDFGQEGRQDVGFRLARSFPLTRGVSKWKDRTRSLTDSDDLEVTDTQLSRSRWPIPNHELATHGLEFNQQVAIHTL